MKILIKATGISYTKRSKSEKRQPNEVIKEGNKETKNKNAKIQEKAHQTVHTILNK